MTLHSKQNWETIDWYADQKTLFKMQKRIYKLSSIGNNDTITQWKRNKALHNMHYYQRLILKSPAAKRLAIKKVTTDNSGRKTAGVDKAIYLKPQDKMKILSRLKMDGKAAPIRRVMIPKPGKKENAH